MIRLAAIAALAGIAVLAAMPAADAKLWDLIIETGMQGGSVAPSENVTVAGRIMDHAYKPVEGANVTLRAGHDTVRTTTDAEGAFEAEFAEEDRAAGTHIINIAASLGTKTGLATTSFVVRGDVADSPIYDQLSTEQARKYLGAEREDFENDPIGRILFDHYHRLLEQSKAQRMQVQEAADNEAHIEMRREAARNATQASIIEERAGPGTYGGYQYDGYVSRLSPEIRDLVTNQLNFTKNAFLNAQILKAEILGNGGTYEEAQRAYLEMLAIPRAALEQFNHNMTSRNGTS